MTSDMKTFVIWDQKTALRTVSLFLLPCSQLKSDLLSTDVFSASEQKYLHPFGQKVYDRMVTVPLGFVTFNFTAYSTAVIARFQRPVVSSLYLCSEDWAVSSRSARALQTVFPNFTVNWTAEISVKNQESGLTGQKVRIWWWNRSYHFAEMVFISFAKLQKGREKKEIQSVCGL